MVNTQKLYSLCLIMLLVAAINFNSNVGLIFGVCALICATLLAVLTPTELKLNVKKLFETNEITNQLFEQFKQDPDFGKALEYSMKLSPADFLRFVRIAAECRAESDRGVLNEIGNAFKRKSK